MDSIDVVLGGWMEDRSSLVGFGYGLGVSSDEVDRYGVGRR